MSVEMLDKAQGLNCVWVTTCSIIHQAVGHCNHNLKVRLTCDGKHHFVLGFSGWSWETFPCRQTPEKDNSQLGYLF